MLKTGLIVSAAKVVTFASRHVPPTEGFYFLSRGEHAKATGISWIREAAKFAHTVMRQFQKRVLCPP